MSSQTAVPALLSLPLLLMAVLLLLVGTRAAGLADPRVAGQHAAISLDGEWQATAADGTSMVGKVPGDVITDLQLAGKIGDPLYELNWKDPAHVQQWNQSWTYQRTLPASLARQAAAGEVLLIFDGIKMGATIKLNGKVLGTATDQFVKYNFSIAGHVLSHVDVETKMPLASVLQVSFDQQPTHGRYMACTGGWDWGECFTLMPLQHWLFTPELQWQSGGKRRILQGCQRETLTIGLRQLLHRLRQRLR